MTLLHTDSRGRVSLGKLLQPNRDYRVTKGTHGQVVLEPITVITDYERAVLDRPELVEALERANQQIAAEQTVERERRPRS